MSPVPVNEEMEQYYAKLLGLKPAIDSGSVDDQGDLTSKYKIIVPDAVKSFPVSALCDVHHEAADSRTTFHSSMTEIELTFSRPTICVCRHYSSTVQGHCGE